MPRLDVQTCTATTARIDGRDMIVFGGCGYLGLNHDPRVRAAVLAGLERFGTSSSASRETTGNTAAHDALEQTLREFFGTPGVVLLPDGYTANIAALQALAPEHDALVLDERSHRSLADAAATAGLPVRLYAHLDADDARRVARACARPLLATDGVFAADGAVAPVRDLADAMPAGARLLVDDCHGVSVLGAGRGSVEAAGLRGDPRLVITTSLAKGVGVAGGCVAGDRTIERLVRGASIYIGTTPIGPALAEGARVALEVIAREPQRVARLLDNARRLNAVLARHGWPGPSTGTPIAAWPVTPALEPMIAAADAAGVLLPRIAYPGGPSGDYLRLAVTSEHAQPEFAALERALEGVRA